MTTRKEILNNDYNPYIYRVRPGQIGDIPSLVNLVKCLLGNGILAMPKAFGQAGLLVGIIMTVFIISLIVYCIHIMFQGMHFLCKRDNVPYVSLPKALQKSMLVGPSFLQKIAHRVPLIVNFLIIIFQFGVCCVYLVFCAKNLKIVIDDNTQEKSHLNLIVYLISFYFPLLCLTYIKNLKLLVPVSNVANLLMLISLLIIYYYVFTNMEPISNRTLAGTPSEYPLFMGTIMYSVFTIGGILSIEQNMVDGEHFVTTFGVLNKGMLVALILNAFTGFFGYWKYGDEIESSITLNLGKNGYAWSVQVFFFFIIMLTFPLQSYPATEILWDFYIAKHMTESKHKIFWDYCIRTIFLTSTYLVAIPLPFLGIIISLVGAFCLSLLGIIVPVIIDVCLRWSEQDFGTNHFYLFRDIFLMVFGMACFIFGTYSPIIAIIAEFN